MIQLVVKAERKRAFEPNCHLTTAVVSSGVHKFRAVILRQLPYRGAVERLESVCVPIESCSLYAGPGPASERARDDGLSPIE